VAPHRHVEKRDPIVTGIIIDPRGGDRKLTFLIAWTINTKDL